MNPPRTPLVVGWLVALLCPLGARAESALSAVAGRELTCRTPSGQVPCRLSEPGCDCASARASQREEAEALIAAGACQSVATPGASLKAAAEQVNEDMVGLLLDHAAQGCAPSLPMLDLVSSVLNGYRWSEGEEGARLRITTRLLAAGMSRDPPSAILYRLSDPYLGLREANEPALRMLLFLLKEVGGDLDENFGWPSGTALHRAAKGRAVALVRALLAAGADANPKDRDGETPLFTVCGQPDSTFGRDQGLTIMEMLLAAGGRPDSRDKHGRSPADRAVQVHWPEAALLLRRHGAPLDASFALDQALRGNDHASIRLALDAGADARKSHGLASPPLCLAVRYSDQSVVSQLIDRGASPGTDCRGRTPLHLAVERGQPALARVLLTRGADPDGAKEKGYPPIRRAYRNRDREMLAELCRHGAAGCGSSTYLGVGATVGLDMPVQAGSAAAMYGLRPTVIRKGAAGPAWGAYLDATTRAFDDALVGGGALLVPAWPSRRWTIAPALGLYARHRAGNPWHPGLAAGLLLSAHADYTEYEWPRVVPDPHLGLRVDAHWSPADPHDRSILVSLQVDLNILWIVPYAICCMKIRMFEQ